MTTTLRPAADAAAGVRTVPPRAAVAALARAEGLRLLRHPAVLAAYGVVLAGWVYQLVTGDAGNAYPVLHIESRFVQLPMLLPAAGTFLAANLLGLRAHRHGTGDLYEVLALTAPARAAAQLLALLPLAVLGLALAGLRLAVLAARPGAAGSLAWAELFTVPAVILVCGALGLLTAHLARSVAAGPIVLVVLGILTLLLLVDNTNPARWLGLIAYEDEFAAPLPAALTGRHAGAHLLWLTALGGLAGTGVLLRTGVRLRPALGALAVCTALAVTAGVLQLRPVDPDLVARRTALQADSGPGERCRTQNGVRYCALPEFTAWTDGWAKVADAELARVPEDVAARPRTVRQHLFLGAGGDSPVPLPASWPARELPVGTRWAGTDGQDADQDDVFGYASAFAYDLVSGGKALPRDHGVAVCGGPGVVLLWLAAQGAPDAYASVDARTYGGAGLNPTLLGSASGLAVLEQEHGTVRRLLDRPAGQVAARLRAHWDRLTEPGTSTEAAARLLGVTAPQRTEADRQGTCA